MLIITATLEDLPVLNDGNDHTFDHVLAAADLAMTELLAEDLTGPEIDDSTDVWSNVIHIDDYLAEMRSRRQVPWVAA